MADYKIDDTVDITDVVCPVTFVKAKVALEEMDEGQVLAVKMNDGEPVQNVPRSIKEEGHQILKLNTNDDGTYIADVKYTSKDKYMITATAIYEEDISNNNLKTALMIGAAVLVFAVAVSLIIFFLKKREKENKND